MINITSTFRLLDIFRSEPFLRLIPLNLSDHQKGIYALRCLVFLVYLIAATSQWSSLLWWIAITNLLLYPISLNDSQVALVLFDIQPANGEANIPSLVVEKHDVTSIRTKEEEKPEKFGMYLCLHVCMCVVHIIPLSYVIVLLC